MAAPGTPWPGLARPAGPARSFGLGAAFAAAGSQWAAESSPPPPRPPSALHHWAQCAALLGTTRLSVIQAPASLPLEQGSQATLTCHMAHDQGWERLRFVWNKNGKDLCHALITHGRLNQKNCGPQGQLSWRAPGTLTLSLGPVSINDSGIYVCCAAVEIPDLVQGKGNGTQLLVEAGFLVALLVVGGVFVIAVGLWLGIWGCSRCRSRESGSPLYSNVLYRSRGTPKKPEASPGEGKVLDPPRANQKTESFYSTSFPLPITSSPRLPFTPPPRASTPPPPLPPKPCSSPKSSYSISVIKVSPSPSFLEAPRLRGSPGIRRGVLSQGMQEGFHQ
ncbi:PREDICTED: transmembrane and immunoglobulin domain-containing protein 2 [Elephantulus edwardii]|uniref:transmembrane and immunoglobulin domain-containing protein 2 n=1 Tax=Elephantulus edwardii TaxID=28737 RepID=UPI0003F0600B|nr:PREDICTED: transmembrane and immunoglobulin domain-containing protein 2 [Elephantulus edwardii]